MVYLFQIFYDYLVIYCYFKGHEMQKNDVFFSESKIFTHRKNRISFTERHTENL